MTIKEITALRKAGQLDEALRNAEIEYQHNVNLYTGGALFWCLKDLLAGQQGEEADDTFKRLNDLYEVFGSQDEVLARAFHSIESRRLPHAQELNEALEQAKSGVNPFQIYNKFVGYYNSSELDSSLFDNFGWLIFYTLKSTPLNDAYGRKTMLAQYLKLDLERPSLLHSLILSEAVKVEQNTPLQFRIRDFIRLWGIENLREDDWSQYHTNDGKILPSLVEKLIGVYAKELKTDGVPATDNMMELVDKALRIYPNSQNMPYFKATILISLGRKEEALTNYRDLIMRFQSKFYLWHQAAELVSEVETKIGLLCKALSTGDDQSFLGGVRLSLAKVLIQQGMLGNAKTELEKYKDLYQSKGWNLKQEFWNLYNSIPPQTMQEDNSALYSKYSASADNFIYNDIPTVWAVKFNSKKIEDRIHPGRHFMQWTLKEGSKLYRLKKPAKFGLDNRTPNGAMFKIKIHDNKIVWIKPANDTPSLNWIKTVSGPVTKRKDRNGKDFAIIQGVYVGKDLLKNVTDGDTITITACRQEDGRWSAIAKQIP